MIGIMADSHDNLQPLKQAVRIFNETGCSLVIHAGDFVAPFAAQELLNCDCTVKAVFGNCDGEKKGLKKIFHSIGEIQVAPLIFNHKDLNIIVTHVPVPLNSHIDSKKFNIIISAHTHKPEIKKGEKTLLINPGETGGWVSGKSTVALLDTKTLTTKIITL